MKFCNCVLPILRGDTECCKNCINKKEIPDGYITEDEKDILFDKLSKINPLEITPIEAINILYELKQITNKK